MRKEAAARRVTFKTALRNLSDLVYFRRYRCHARSVTVALNQQRYELSRGLRSRKAIYVTRENVNDSRSRAIIVIDVCFPAQSANLIFFEMNSENEIESEFFSRESWIFTVLPYIYLYPFRYYGRLWLTYTAHILR